MNYSTDLKIIDNIIQSNNFSFHILDHPMKPFGMRYWEIGNWWENYDGKIPGNFTSIEDFLERSPQLCSWLRDQEYLVDFKYYDRLEFKDGSSTNYLHVFPKVRSVLNENSS